MTEVISLLDYVTNERKKLIKERDALDEELRELEASIAELLEESDEAK
jgi:hypothetical protein